MAFTPDLPFPKSAGDPLRSKDWNDLVTEAQRLDTAKLERAGDAITGSLSIATALAVGKAAATAGAAVDIDGGDLRINDRNLLLRPGGDVNHGLGWFGTGKEWGGLNIDGPVLYGFSGGALGTTDGGAKAALSWNKDGRVGIGVSVPDFRVDVADRIRLRQGADSSAGLWLHQTTPDNDRAFIGMAGDDTLGLWGNQGVGWGLTMNTTNGNLGVRTMPISTYGLFINPGAVAAQPALSYGLVIGGGSTSNYSMYVVGNAYVSGRVRDGSRLRAIAIQTNSTSTSSTSYVQLPNMQMTVSAPDIGMWVQISLQVNGVQTQGSTTIGAYFRLLVDGAQVDMTRHEFNNNGWELRGVTLGRVMFLSEGNHTIAAQWATTSGTLTCCWYGDSRQLQAIEV